MKEDRERAGERRTFKGKGRQIIFSFDGDGSHRGLQFHWFFRKEVYFLLETNAYSV